MAGEYKREQKRYKWLREERRICGEMVKAFGQGYAKRARSLKARGDLLKKKASHMFDFYLRKKGHTGRLTIDGKPIGQDPAEAQASKPTPTVVPFPKGA